MQKRTIVPGLPVICHTPLLRDVPLNCRGTVVSVHTFVAESKIANTKYVDTDVAVRWDGIGVRRVKPYCISALV